MSDPVNGSPIDARAKHAPSPLPAELRELQDLIEGAEDGAVAGFSAKKVGSVTARQHELPLWMVTLGNPDPSLPAIGFFGGVHGLERIGSAVVIAWLRQLLMRLPWDESLQAQLERTRIVFMPVLNPGGLLLGTRANPNGVDLMRNAPIDADSNAPHLLSGHRISRVLPWYRGALGEPMQVEAAALCSNVEHEFTGRPFCVAVDCHSGFGMRDRIWFPYAYTRAPMSALPEMHALAALFDRCHPQHRYLIEPQSRQYLTHGDLWDHLHRRLQEPGKTFLPLTLEMGSWLWVRKNLRQLFSFEGMFNPRTDHRQRRVLRHHLPWFDFLLRATASYGAWLPDGPGRDAHRQLALQRWYGATNP